MWQIQQAKHTDRLHTRLLLVVLSNCVLVEMMQAPNARNRHNPAGGAWVGFCNPSSRCFLRQTKVRPILVVVADMIAHRLLEMSIVQNDDMIEQIAAATTDRMSLQYLLP
jgi:hypothetical protein